MLLTLHRALDQNGLEIQKLDVCYGDSGENISYIVKPFIDNPEDAIVGRGLLSAKQLIKYLKIAYEAGKNGEYFVESECMNTNSNEW